MKRLVRYLKGTKDVVLHLNVDTRLAADARTGRRTVLKGKTDTDWAGDTETRKRTTCGFVILWGGFLIHSHCRSQTVRGLSSTEAEYYCCCGIAAELLYARSLIEDIGYPVDLERD